ncbi:MAG TPA: hypothetical protein VGI81_00500 [Tepidisphaeraceae bacterium]|jgi:hypothetical protein
MIRRLFAAALAMSLLVCLCTVTLCVRSYWRWDQISGDLRRKDGAVTGEFEADSAHGEFGATIALFATLPTRPAVIHPLRWDSGNGAFDWSGGRFHFALARNGWIDLIDRHGLRTDDEPDGHTARPIRGPVFEVRSPLFAVAMVIGFPPLAYGIWRGWGKRRRRLASRCLLCGYDLRASTDRCPECGTPISSTSKPARLQCDDARAQADA